jgi:glycosyltransferase involved in cell wall biosynthesis
MKVVVAGYQAVSLLHGGPNTQIRNTVKYLSDFGVQATLFDPWAPFVPGDIDLFHLFAGNIGTYHLGREIHTTGVPLALSPIIYSRHSHQFIRTSLTAGRLLQNLGQGVWMDYIFAADMCGWARAILPNSQAEADLVTEGLGADPSRVTVIPNGVDERFAHGDPDLFRKQFGLDRFILNVGHIGHRRKNVLNLIKALSTIDYPSVIIGRFIEGPYLDACRKEAEPWKQIRLINGLDNSSDLLASAYAACDVFVLPSLFETPGIAALEAALAGAKIVITPYGGTREYFGTMAGYVDPDSPGSIRNGILTSLAEPKSTVLRDHVRSRYLWPRVAELTARAYLDSLGRA